METKRPTLDFDHNSTAYAADPQGILAAARSTCPVAFTEAHGGFWLLTRYDDVAAIGRDDVNYSSFNDAEGGHVRGAGNNIPGNAMRAGIIEEDEPTHSDQRKLISPFFSSARIRAWSDWLAELTTRTIDELIEGGECDLVADFATIVPLKFTFRLVGLPAENADIYKFAFHTNMYVTSGMPEYRRVLEAMEIVKQDIVAAIADRRAVPREDDFITTLCHSEINGQPLTEQAIIDITIAVLGGGIDTTTGLVSAALLWLSQNPAARRRLIEEPALLPSAVEEFLRFFSPIQGLARTVVNPRTVGGCVFSAGDRVMLSWAGANHDPEKFDRPQDVVLDRFPNQHQAFGVGAHRCIGMNFARVEAQLMIGEVLRRMPDYTIEPDSVVRYPNIGLANGFISLPTRFAPGLRAGTQA